MRHTRKKGGRFYGKGAFGAVMGDPRFPCLDETVDEIKDNNEVGKIFTKQQTFNEENAIMRRLRAVLSEAQIEQLKEYIVLPSKSCEVDLIKAKNTDIYKNKEWYKDKTGVPTDSFEYDERRGMFIQDSIKPVYSLYQMSYPRAENELYDVVKQYQNGEYKKADLYIALKHICELYNGLKELQKLDLVHGDIKLPNAVVIDGKAKFIDISQMTQINIYEEENKEAFRDLCNWTSLNSVYYPWSELAVFGLTENTRSNRLNVKSAFDETYGSDPNYDSIFHLLSSLEMWMKIFSDNRLKLDADVKSELESEFIKICVNRLYGITGMNTIDEPMNENRYDLRLVKDAIFYFLDRMGMINITTFLNTARVSRHPPHIVRAARDFKAFVNKLNTAFSVDDGMASDAFRMKRMDYILKMNDIHSMGVVLMELVKLIRPDGVDDEMKPIVKKALEVGIASLKQYNPENVDEYYTHRHNHFNHIFEMANELATDVHHILNPRVSTASRRSSTIRTPHSRKRSTLRKVKSVRKSAPRRKTRRHSR